VDESSMEIELPEATPSAYVEWVEWWNEVDRVVSQSQVLRAMLSSRTMTARPGLARRTNRFRSVFDQVELQASVALRLRYEPVHVTIIASQRLLRELGEAMEITARFVRWWLEDPGAAEAVGLPNPSWQVELLHAAVGDAIRSRAGTMAGIDDAEPDDEAVVDLGDSRGEGRTPPRTRWTRVSS
jgi:hypothetical protein